MVEESTSSSFLVASILGSYTGLLEVVRDRYGSMMSRGRSSGEASYRVSISGSSSDVVQFRVVALESFVLWLGEVRRAKMKACSGSITLTFKRVQVLMVGIGAVDVKLMSDKFTSRGVPSMVDWRELTAT